MSRVIKGNLLSFNGLREVKLDVAAALAPRDDADPGDAASEYLARARREADRIREEARAKGYRDGYAEGQRQAREELKAKLEESERIRREASAEREAMLRGLKPQMVELSLAIARRLVRREISQDRSVVLRLLEEALSLVSRDGPVVARVNPEDAEALKNETGLGREIEVVADASVTPGGALLETPDGWIDGTVEAQIEALATALEVSKGDV